MSDTEPSSPEPPSSNDRTEPDDDAPSRSSSAEVPYSFDLLDRGGLLAPPVHDALDRQVRAALDASNAHGEIRVDVVDDSAMSYAHMEYLEIEGTTDVLTFDLTNGASAEGVPLDVDIMICVDEAGRQATDLGHPIEHEMTLYIIHGVLHCLGFDDVSEEESRRMHAEEDRLLTAAGIGAVFDPHRAPDDTTDSAAGLIGDGGGA